MNKEISLRELINPTPRQEEFLKATDSYKYPLFGGAKGGGKSYILRWGLVRKLVKWAKEGHLGVRVGLFCEDYPALKDRQITKMAKEFPEWLGTLADSQIEGMSFKLKKEFGGGVIALRNLDDPSKYASSEFAIGAIDELTKNRREVFDQLRPIIRWPGIENTGLWGGTNPGEIGHEWVKKLFIDRQFSLEDPSGEQVHFIKSLPTDNPHNAQSYLQDLQRLPEKLKKAYWDGNWDVFEGQYFSEWDRDQHVIAPITIQAHWKRYRAYDHGRENPACCSWYAIDSDGHVYKYRELYIRGLDVDQLAQKIKEMSLTYHPATGQLVPEYYEYSVADPAIFAKLGYVDRYGGQTIAETFAHHGVTFLPASNRRIDGWMLMHQYYRWDENNKPKMQYFSTCRDSIRTIPSLIHDEYRPEDLDTRGEDHAADTDRYFLMSIHEGVSPKPMTDTEKKFKQMKDQNDNPLAKFEI